MSNLFSEDGAAKRIPVPAAAGFGLMWDGTQWVTADIAGALALPAQIATGRSVIGTAAAAATYSLGEAGGGNVAGSLGAYGTLRLDPADCPALLGKTAKLRVRGRVVTNQVAPAVDFTFFLKPVTSWTSGANPIPNALGAALGTATIAAPAAASAVEARGAAFAFPAAGDYVLLVAYSATTAVGSSTHIHVCLDRIYS